MEIPDDIVVYPSFVQIETRVPRGLNILRVYDSTPVSRYMAYMWDRFEHMELPRSVGLDELKNAQMLALKARETF